MAEISGGEVMVRMLQAEGVQKVFGIIDGIYFGFYASLRTHGIDLVTPRHETGAVHMAGAYARLTGKLRRMHGVERARGRRCRRFFAKGAWPGNATLRRSGPA